MPVIVTINMYSGRPNPAWELSDADAQTLVELLGKNREPCKLKSPASLGKLGYRGVQIEFVAEPAPFNSLRAFDGVLESSTVDAPNFIDNNSEVEDFLVKTSGLTLSDDEATYIQQEIEKNVRGGVANSTNAFRLMAAPPFNPSKWNNDPNVCRNNNCYNYANDTITNTFAQPGRGSGQNGPYPYSCTGTGKAAKRDGQRPIANPDITPSHGHIIALVIAKTQFVDYHWYRRDKNKMWSHKPGYDPARNTDDSGNLISDPRKCDRGPYDIFCGFYHCLPSETRIR